VAAEDRNSTMIAVTLSETKDGVSALVTASVLTTDDQAALLRL